MQHARTSSHKPPLKRVALGLCAGLLLTCQTSASVAQAGFSPYFERTGKGAFDQYNNTLLCAAIMERALTTEADSTRKERLELGVEYAIGFAGYVLESGNVVEPGGTILGLDNLPTDRAKAQDKWRNIAKVLEQQNQSSTLEKLWCLQQYGHKW